jgi:hypothetical protein
LRPTRQNLVEQNVFLPVDEVCTFLGRRFSFWSKTARKTLPVDKVHVPHQPEGLPSVQQGTCSLLARRKIFCPARYM